LPLSDRRKRLQAILPKGSPIDILWADGVDLRSIRTKIRSSDPAIVSSVTSLFSIRRREWAKWSAGAPPAPFRSRL
jgi:hypothetical protein